MNEVSKTVVENMFAAFAEGNVDKTYDVKGLLVDGYGIYSEPLTNEMISKLKTH